MGFLFRCIVNPAVVTSGDWLNVADVTVATRKDENSDQAAFGTFPPPYTQPSSHQAVERAESIVFLPIRTGSTHQISDGAAAAPLPDPLD